MRKWFLMCIASGALLGMSFPSYPYVRLEFLSLFALIPLFQVIEKEFFFWSFIRKVYLSMFVWVLISVWWVSTSTLFFGITSALTGVMLYFAQSAFSTVPFIFHFYIRKYFSSSFSLWLFPFIWVCWEFLYFDLEIAFPWLTVGNAFSNNVWLIQYADITGVYGISFWIILCNVALFKSLKKSWDLKRILILTVGLFSFPLIYGIVSFFEYSRDFKEEIKVSIIQPNINPYKKWDKSNSALLSIYNNLIDSALKDSQFELVVLPETAFPNYLFHPSESLLREQVKQIAFSRKLAIIFGFPDIVYDDHKKDPKAISRRYDIFNSSALISNQLKTKIYHKIKLVPFGERVPYMEVFPLLSKLTIEIAGISSWSKGSILQNFQFKSQDGVEVITPGLICYESIFPEFVASFVQKGANALCVITNDGWFLKTYGPYQHAAFSRLRSIENRRSLIRCANTGISFFIDPFGRIYGEIPWWNKSFSTEKVQLNSELTFFTKYPKWFPVFCAVSIFCFLICSIIFLRRKK